MSKIELHEEELNNVSGGKITYSWDGTSGKIGLNGNNFLVLLDKDAFVSYYKSIDGTGMSDADVLNNLIAKGIAKMP